MPDFDADASLLAGHLTWLVTRARTMSDTKLGGRPSGSSISRADLLRGLLQRLADADVGLAQRSEPVEPSWPQVPRLRDLAVGDQLAVLGHDLLSALDAAAAQNPEVPQWIVWTPLGRQSLVAVVSELAADAGRLRELL